MAVVTASGTDSLNFHPAVENLEAEAFPEAEVFLLWEGSDLQALAAQSAS